MAPITSKIPIVPGPIVTGIARGTTANCKISLSPTFAVSLFPRTNSTAVKNSNAPAPILKASSVIPKISKICFPKNNNTKLITITEVVTLIANAFLSFDVAS